MATKKTTKKASKKKEVAIPWKQALAKHVKGGKAPKEKPATTNFISLKGAKFSIGKQPIGRELDCVILGWCFEKSHYDSDYVEGESGCPGCFALSYDEDSLTPHDDSPNKQDEDCASCWANEWGSGKGDGKACADRRRLVLAVEGKEGDVEIKLMNIPPTSLNNWKGFYQEIDNMGLHTMQCAVNISFDQDSTASYPPLVFEFLNEITREDTLQAMANMIPETERLLEQPYDVSNYGKEETKDKKKRTPAKKKTTKKKTTKKKTTKKKTTEKRRGKFS